jgi:hypothetical protein
VGVHDAVIQQGWENHPESRHDHDHRANLKHRLKASWVRCRRSLHWKGLI